MIWDAHTLKPIYVIEAHADNIMDLDFSPDSRYLASASLDNTIKIWDVKTGEIVRVLTGHEGGVSSIDFSPDGKHLISGSVDLSIRLWEASNGHVIYTYAHHDAPINCVRYNHAGDQFVSAAQDEKILIWKLTKDVFVNYYFEADITHEINESPLFLPRQNNESRDEYKARQEEAEEFKNELFDKYYQKYLDMKEEQSITP
jgi:WD40 repeat protein